LALESCNVDNHLELFIEETFLDALPDFFTLQPLSTQLQLQIRATNVHDAAIFPLSNEVTRFIDRSFMAKS
jgi:hypothetical protein